MKLKRPLYGPTHPDGPSEGLDVRAMKRAALRYARREMHFEGSLVDDELYGSGLEKLVTAIQRREQIVASGDIGRATANAIWGYQDALGKAWYAKFKVPSGELIEPVQGWDSLTHHLWEAYSEGVRRGFTDLGTYVAKPLDHGGRPNPVPHPPAFAFDLGDKNRFFFKGWGYLKARRYANWLVANAERLGIGYVILGSRIWTDDGRGWHAYDDDGSHRFHVHVSAKKGLA